MSYDGAPGSAEETRTDELRGNSRRPRTQDDARELLASNFSSDPYKQIEELRGIGARKARAEGVAYRLEHERKIILARIANEIATVHAKEKLSEAKLDRMARADSRYQIHIEGLGAAVEERELARSEYWAIKSLLEFDRASIAHLNALSRLELP